MNAFVITQSASNSVKLQQQFHW